MVFLCRGCILHLPMSPSSSTGVPPLTDTNDLLTVLFCFVSKQLLLQQLSDKHRLASCRLHNPPLPASDVMNRYDSTHAKKKSRMQRREVTSLRLLDEELPGQALELLSLVHLLNAPFCLSFGSHRSSLLRTGRGCHR